MSVTSKLRKSLSSVERIFIVPLAIFYFMGDYSTTRLTDFASLCGRLLGLAPAFQWYKVHVCRIKGQEIALFCREDLYSSSGGVLLDGRLLHNWSTYFAALCGKWLGLTPAFQRYKVRFCRIQTHEFSIFCRECIR